MPAVDIFQILLLPPAIQRLPSGPTAIPLVPIVAGLWNSLIVTAACAVRAPMLRGRNVATIAAMVMRPKRMLGDLRAGVTARRSTLASQPRPVNEVTD